MSRPESSALDTIVAVPPTPFLEDGSLDLPGFEQVLARAASLSAIKEALALRSVIGRTVRPPISELGPDERADIGRIRMVG